MGLYIYIVKTGEIEYKDNYYYFNLYNLDVSVIYTSLTIAIEEGLKQIETFYNDYKDNLDEIEWGSYYFGAYDEDLNDEKKLKYLKELTEQIVKIDIYELNATTSSFDFVKCHYFIDNNLETPIETACQQY